MFISQGREKSTERIEASYWKQSQQIPYIGLIMPDNEQYSLFLDFVKKDKRLKWTISREGYDLETNLRAGRFVLTRDRRARTKKELVNAEWNNTTGQFADDISWRECFQD